NATRFVEQALKITYDYLIENKYETTPIKLNIKSELADSSGRKYGLGSSAAVVTSVVQAVLERFMPEQMSKMLVFKVASLVHVITQENGTGEIMERFSLTVLIRRTPLESDW